MGFKILFIEFSLVLDLDVRELEEQLNKKKRKKENKGANRQIEIDK